MKRTIIEIDRNGNLVIPAPIREQFQLVAGSKLLLEVDEDRIHLSRPSSGLNRLYIEATNHCNLNCSTCIRKIWGDQLGFMPVEGFQKIIQDLRRFPHIPEIFFGGYGEPLAHPEVDGMVSSAHQIGARTSLITNGTLLTEEMSERLHSAGLDMLWVSIDGAHPESYQDIRLGDHLPQIIENLKAFTDVRTKKYGSSPWAGRPQLGFAFVLMKKNAADLKAVIELGRQHGASQFYVTNLLAYSQEMSHDLLYEKCIYHSSGQWEGTQPRVWMPRLDFEDNIPQDLADLVMKGFQVKIAGNIINRNPFLCPFAARGAAAVRWDGEVSPCLPLLYEHTSIFEGWDRRSYPYSAGNAFAKPIGEIWLDPEYQAFRERLLMMNFSPCVDCHTCVMAEDNLLDCTGYQHPNCGGCLWAHGLIQCP